MNDTNEVFNPHGSVPAAAAELTSLNILVWLGFFCTGTITVALDKADSNDILVSQIFLFKHFFNFSNFQANARGARR